jgi:hypothetical protein
MTRWSWPAWDDLVRSLARYPTAVLTVNDATGYPFSVRCVPEPDPARQVLKVTMPRIWTPRRVRPGSCANPKFQPDPSVDEHGPIVSF